MAKKLILVSILLIALFLLMTVSQAQDSDEGCSLRETVYPVVKTAILDEASYQGVRVRHAAPGERLDIIGSKTFGAWCWLQVSEGWLIDSVRALRSEPRCYEADKAYVTGNMNIRAAASTTSPVVANARVGDVFAVSKSLPGETWCWLKIDLGWLAKTSWVRATEPPPIPVVGSSEFVRQVEATLNWMESRAPEWYDYVIGGMDRIFELPNSNPGWCGGFAYSDQRGVGIQTCMIDWAQQRGMSARIDQLELANLLAHEACHIHRHEAGFVYNAATRNHEEEECMKPMFGVGVALDPYGSYLTVTTDSGESALSLVERYCSEGIEDPVLYCPIVERLQGG